MVLMRVHMHSNFKKKNNPPANRKKHTKPNRSVMEQLRMWQKPKYVNCTETRLKEAEASSVLWYTNDILIISCQD